MTNYRFIISVVSCTVNSLIKEQIDAFDTYCIKRKKLSGLLDHGGFVPTLTQLVRDFLLTPSDDQSLNWVIQLYCELEDHVISYVNVLDKLYNLENDIYYIYHSFRAVLCDPDVKIEEYIFINNRIGQINERYHFYNYNDLFIKLVTLNRIRLKLEECKKKQNIWLIYKFCNLLYDFSFNFKGTNLNKLADDHSIRYQQGQQIYTMALWSLVSHSTNCLIKKNQIDKELEELYT